MKTLVLIKQVPDTEARITVSGGKISESGIKWIISPYDEIALEEAIRIKEKQGGEVTVVTVGSDSAQQIIRTAFAMGADNGILVQNDSYEMLDASTITAALRKVVEEGSYDLILAGRQGADSDNGQVATMLGTQMDIAILPFVAEIEVGDGKIKATVEADGGRATYEASLPAIVTANAGLNEPRYPNLKGIMAAKKKPIDIKTISDLGIEAGSTVEIIGYEAPPERPAGKIIEGETPEDKAKELARILHEEAKLI